MKVLVVEDDAAIRHNLVFLLRIEGFEALEADNGEAGLALARTHLPDLVLCDVMMPQLDGYGMLTKLRADPLTAAIPLIFLTARTERSDQRKGMNLGADDYLGKPFSREEVLEAVNARLQRRHDVARAEAAEQADAQARHDTVVLKSASISTPLDIKGYRLIRKIGGGGMSEVYLAERESDRLEVALKLLDTRTQQDNSMLHRFIQEHELLERIDHPNVARIYDHGFTDEHAFITMKYFPSGDIKRRIAKGLSPAEALSITVQAALALEQIHALGIVHRDVKPENLMLRANGSVALIDFGVAKHTSHNLGQTLHGEIVGSPFYLSPEQAAGKAVSPASDLYALGVIFFEMLTGKRPFVAQTMEAMLSHHLFSPAPLLEPRFSAYQDLLNLLLKKEPSHRFDSARSVVEFITRHWPHTVQVLPKR
ncbi:protein kinase domain-containing protein [Rhodoferax aquaticus]|uniref:protein kinase domain-containing protein n=1 Tax=Rhodoferax aquaticus TaxID=2527691 RepID=UPI00143CE323|nr:protein kinase [Rhodoferax aquaticus]